MLDEEIKYLRSKIIPRLQKDFPVDTEQWRRYVNISATREELTVADVIAAFSTDDHIPDEDKLPHMDFQPGDHHTLPWRLDPDHLFDSTRAAKNETTIPYPWPYFQKWPMYSRIVAPHPVVFPPTMWIGMNDMYIPVRVF